MPNDHEAPTPDNGNQVFYQVVQSASDPNRQWLLIGTDFFGNECCRIGFKTYGDAWHAAESRKSDEEGRQADLLAGLAQRLPSQANEYKLDILTWSERQASLLRRVVAGEKVSDQVDWDNVIDEVEFAGRRQLAEVKSLLVQALAFRLRIWAWPRSADVVHWQTDALDFQRQAIDMLSPAMRRRIDINEFYFKAIRRLPKTIDGEEAPFFPAECPLTLEDLLGD